MAVKGDVSAPETAVMWRPSTAEKSGTDVGDSGEVAVSSSPDGGDAGDDK